MHSNNAGSPPLLATLRAALPGLPPAQQRLARLALADPYSVGRLTITDFAARGDTSPASVTRLCHALGLDSYAALRMELALAGQRLGEDGPQRISGDITAESELSDVVEGLASLDTRAVQDTARLLDLDVLARVVDVVGDAGHVYLTGGGSSRVVAVYLELKLRTLGIPTTTFYDLSSSMIGVAVARPGDVVVVITPTGTARESIPVITEAKLHGAIGIVITANAKLPVVGVADLALFTVHGESSLRTGVMSSRVAEIFVADCIIGGLVARRHEQSVAALTAVEKAMARNP